MVNGGAGEVRSRGCEGDVRLGWVCGAERWVWFDLEEGNNKRRAIMSVIFK